MQLFSSVSGNGETVIFVHGLFSSSRIWTGIIEKLGHTYRTLTLDLLGFGKSPKPDLSYTLNEHTDAVEETILRAKLQKPYILVGQSIGSVILLEYARRHPRWVKKLVLISPPAYESAQEGKMKVRKYAGMWYWFSFGLFGYSAHAIEQFLKPLVILFLPKISTRYTKPILLDTFEHTWRSYSGTMFHIVYSSHVYSTLREVQIPTTIFYGSADALIISQRLIELAKVNSFITLKKLDGKHQFIYDYTHVLADEII